MYRTSKPYTKKLIDVISTTWNTPYCHVYRTSDYPIVEEIVFRKKIHTDGIGTKGKLHWKYKTLIAAVQDAMAMNLNDMLTYKAPPYMMNAHLTLPKDDDESIFWIVESLAYECKKRGIAYVGGETSIMDNIDGIDISLTMAGSSLYQREQKANLGDAIVGFASSGIHCNGLTLARRILGEDVKELTTPTTIYIDSLWTEIFNANAVINVTGGAFTRLKSLLNENIDIKIKHFHKLYPQKIFFDIYHKGFDCFSVNSKIMYSTFNCGIGMIAFMPKEKAAELVSKKLPFEADIIGEVIPGNGKAIIESKFSGMPFVMAAITE